jgi:hypothetical protein
MIAHTYMYLQHCCNSGAGLLLGSVGDASDAWRGDITRISADDLATSDERHVNLLLPLSVTVLGTAARTWSNMAFAIARRAGTSDRTCGPRTVHKTVVRSISYSDRV